VDEEATRREREGQRQKRLNGISLASEKAERGQVVRQVAEYLEEASINGQRVLRCRSCRHVLCAADDDFRRVAVRRERPLAEAGPWLALPWQGQSPHFVLVESICPSCGVLLDVKETRKAPVSGESGSQR
jgi:acetone carboxylase gamma subunit